MARQYHIQLDEGECAPYVLLPGDPGRVETVASLWDSAREVARNREYVTYSGEYQGIPLTCTSTGIGASSTAIAVEELARVGAKVFLRIGTCGAFQQKVQNGDMVIFDAAARYDGASRAYAPLEMPAVADHTVIAACIQAAESLAIRYHVGTTRTHDGLYARQPKPGGSFANYWQSEWADHYQDLQRMNVLASEMEASVILLLAKIWGLRAGGIAASVINLMQPAADEGEYDPEKDFDHSTENIINLSRMGSEALAILARKDMGIS